MLMDEDDTILSFILIRKKLFSNNSPGVIFAIFGF